MIISISLVLVVGISCGAYYVWKKELYVPKIPFNPKSDLRDNIENIEMWFDSISRKNKFNGAVCIKYKNQVLLKRTFGNRSFNNIKVNNDTMFRLASLSKSYTAFGIMWLIKKYKLSYDEPITTYLKLTMSCDITIRNLLNQTSGIQQDYISLAKKMGKPNNEYVLTIQDAVKLIIKSIKENSVEPNKQYLYNNSNYILLAGIIEEVSGKTFEEFMRSEVFEPLELFNTRVWNLVSDISIEKIKCISQGFESYLNSDPLEVKPTWIDGVAGDGAVFSSVNDLEKWSSIWDSNKLLTPEELSPAFELPKLNNGKTSNYGFGWVLNADSFWHNGKWLAANSFLMRSKTNDFSLILVDNSTNMRFEKISEMLLIRLQYLKILN
ncbi:serine hydrolase domain-containing protein [Tenacibaculum xiamenense]|uniref:serine hydrolase domain-containing protein n=1 Tax=Tenacibaculum xiamenense TaxID=1261553 RepID=UPI003893A016